MTLRARENYSYCTACLCCEVAGDYNTDSYCPACYFNKKCDSYWCSGSLIECPWCDCRPECGCLWPAVRCHAWVDEPSDIKKDLTN